MVEAADLANINLVVEGGAGDVAIKEASIKFEEYGKTGPRFVSRGSLLAYIALQGDSEKFKKLINTFSKENKQAALEELERLEKYEEENSDLFR